MGVWRVHMQNFHLLPLEIAPELPGCHKVEFVPHPQGVYRHADLLDTLVQRTVRLTHDDAVVSVRAQKVGQLQYLLFPPPPPYFLH